MDPDNEPCPQREDGGNHSLRWKRVRSAWVCEFCDRSRSEILRSGRAWPTTPEEQALYEGWRVEVANGDTILGFRDWITNTMEAG